MKQIIALFIILSLQSFTDTNHDIVGLWESKDANGNTRGTTFKKDGTFVSYVNKKAFSSGRYTFSEDTIAFVEDNYCTGRSGVKITGVYKMVFFVTDSVRLEAVNDSCADRRKAVSGGKIGRVKKAE